MKIVITGATGHLGRHVTHRLARAAHAVVAVSRGGALPEPPFREQPLPAGAITAVAADLADDRCVDVLAAHLGPEVSLVHLAAWRPAATAPTTADDRRRLIEVNVMGTMRVLEAARRQKPGVRAVVYASTSSVYGESVDSPLTEASRTRPLTDHGATRLSGEHHLRSFSAEEGGIRQISLRMPAVHGAGDTTRRALSWFLEATARGEAPTIDGDGAELRDVLHARDAALAVELALHSSASGTFNIADGQAHSLASLARAALDAAGLALEPVFAPSPRPRRDLHMSIARAREVLGFAPTVGLLDGLREQLAWLQGGGA
jgi:UDP-glucose 4-epimerase